MKQHVCYQVEFGDLHGNGKGGDDCAGPVHCGRVLTLELDTTDHILSFRVDGRPHGSVVVGGCASAILSASLVQF